MTNDKKKDDGKLDKAHGNVDLAHDSSGGILNRPLTVSYDKPIPPEKPKKD